MAAGGRWEREKEEGKGAYREFRVYMAWISEVYSAVLSSDKIMQKIYSVPVTGKQGKVCECIFGVLAILVSPPLTHTHTHQHRKPRLWRLEPDS